MSASDLVSALTFLVQLGIGIKNRLDSLEEAAGCLQLLNTNRVLFGEANILDALQSIEQSYKKIRNTYKRPDLLAEINLKTAQLRQIYSAVNTIIVSEITIRTQQRRTDGTETSEASTVVRNPALHGNLFDLDLKMTH